MVRSVRGRGLPNDFPASEGALPYSLGYTRRAPAAAGKRQMSVGRRRNALGSSPRCTARTAGMRRGAASYAQTFEDADHTENVVTAIPEVFQLMRDGCLLQIERQNIHQRIWGGHTYLRVSVPRDQVNRSLFLVLTGLALPPILGSSPVPYVAEQASWHVVPGCRNGLDNPA